MSTLRTNTLSDVAGTNSPDVTRGEFLRARFNLNGTGVIAARDSFNISSFTDVGTGIYTATFSAAMPNASYTGAGTTNSPGTTSGIFVLPPGVVGDQSASSAKVASITLTDVVFDAIINQCAFFGDKS